MTSFKITVAGKLVTKRNYPTGLSSDRRLGHFVLQLQIIEEKKCE